MGIFIVLFVVLAFLVSVAFGELSDGDGYENDTVWSFDNCDYKGDCLRDCPYREECPFYTYKKEMGYE